VLHVESLDIEYPAPPGEKLINYIRTISVAHRRVTELFVIHRKGSENAIQEQMWRDGYDFIILLNGTSNMALKIFME
jgi:hypothetical protein